MNTTEQVSGFLACRWDSRPAWSPETAAAVADFHNRTQGMFSQVRDLALMGQYAKLQGWVRISDVLLARGAEVAA
jgi:hypothetical protein